MAASASTAYMHAAVAFNKVAGTLSLHTDQSIRWVPSSSSSGVSSFHVKFADVAGLQTSKAGSAQIALMLVLANGVQIATKPKVLLVFNAAQSTALEDRDKFKDELAAAVARNRANADGGGASAISSAPTSPSPGAAASSTTATRGGTPDTRAPTPALTRPSSATTFSPAPVSAPSAKRQRAEAPKKTDIELRISVIRSNPQLRALHKDIVISGQMSDAEFWSHPQRQRLIRAERVKLEQRAGRNARLADPKPTPNEAGEMKLSITPELIRDLFEQFPIVARAYEENVPTKLDEGAFWTRYFQSKLYHRLRTSARSAASQHIVQDDAIFDQYLEEEDNELEPRKMYNPHDRLLDLQATEEDHGETGNEKDWTMRAGAERRTLPLMRRFNDHSQSLLDSALGDQEEQDRRKRRRIVGGVGEEYAPGSAMPTSILEGKSGNSAKLGRIPHGDDVDHDNDEANDSVDWIKNHYYKEIVIDDLNETAKSDKVRLNMANLQGYFTGTSTNLEPETNSSSNGRGSKSQPIYNSASNNDNGTSTTTSSLSLEIVPRTVSEYVGYVERFNTSVERASISLGNFQSNSEGTEASMFRMLENLRSRSVDFRTKRAGFGFEDGKMGEEVLKSVVTLQASTTEFLRQFWNAIAPGFNDNGDLHGDDDDDVWKACRNGDGDGIDTRFRDEMGEERERRTKEQEAEENRLMIARKMAFNLTKFEAKLESLLNNVTVGLNESLDNKVNALLIPTNKAVQKALTLAKRRHLIA
ncbi:related to TFB1 - subunit of RNA polymerase II transcription initiation factor TFIIH [Melanopsichium pennsylvanicum]|uniref:Related to TFB1 - subunit of RNA polymerase II transcription initiation factor TFIIH n=2 Tax=Melanopsichium pennsylvanicum TaxID=63383 RepID=A0AAJ4XPE7_9BASI|nr:related to TFB1 - subunit of RNA polymerase II transcription initiation factor TFIIH [Melanopsichium pennsylvanicum]